MPDRRDTHRRPDRRDTHRPGRQDTHRLPGRHPGRQDTHRLFFVVWPSDALRSRIELAVGPIVAGTRGRPVPPRNFHLTLAFLGAVPHSRVAAAIQAGAQTRGTQFELTFHRVESWRGSRLLCLTAAEAPPALATLVGDLRSRLLQAEFRTDAEEFRPHVTLARDMPRAQSPEAVPPVVWRVREFVLVESQQQRNGSTLVPLLQECDLPWLR